MMNDIWCNKCKSRIGDCRMAGCDNCDRCCTTPETENHITVPRDYQEEIPKDDEPLKAEIDHHVFLAHEDHAGLDTSSNFYP